MSKTDEQILVNLCAKVKAGELAKDDIYTEYVRIKQEMAIISLEEIGCNNSNSLMRQDRWWE